MSVTEIIKCLKRGTILNDTPEENRKPCPQCGSKLRNIEVVATVTAKSYVSLEFKHKDPTKSGKAKVLAEGFNGYKYSHGQQKNVSKQMLIDRKDDIYREIISDPETKEVIHKCEESLRQHQGHGSAKLSRGRRNKKKS